MFSNKMIPDVDMLGPGVLNRVVRDCYGACVITKDRNLTQHKPIITELTSDPEDQSTSATYINIFYFSCRGRNIVLSLAIP